MKTEERMTLFVRGIWDWFARHKRTLPWRDLRVKDADHRAYLVLVSEVMLQQTQVPRVVVLYKKFIQKFPRCEDLSRATNAEVLTAWRGLGYNSRALRLRDAARIICEEHDGRFPRTVDGLMAIPGIGHYTASAVLNFAFGIPAACIDTNVRRILHRFFIGPENADGTWKRDDRFLLKLSEQTLMKALEEGRGSSADWFAALMDFGSLVCTKNRPRWQEFSRDLRSSCIAYGKDIRRTKKLIKKEPGRVVSGRHIPDRIFRGRIVEALRDAPRGLTLDDIGSHITVDWTMGDHRGWLSLLLAKLERDDLVQRRGQRFSLAQGR